jgi:putative transposase
MSQKRLRNIVNLDSKYRDVSNWPIVNIMQLEPEIRELYNKRETAIKQYMQGELTLAQITEATGIQKKELLKYVKKCLEFDPVTNIIWGFRALIPNKRISNYNRKAPTTYKTNETETKFNGAFSSLMKNYPEIEKKIISTYLRRKNKKTPMPILNGEGIHQYFLKLCEKEGLGIHDYPFNTDDKALRSLYRFFKKIENDHFSEGAKIYGEAAGRQANWRQEPQEDNLLLKKPYQRVQFDGHRIDAIFTITFMTPEGDFITEVIDRIWLLVIVDVATRSVLGHHISVNKEYNLDDVLCCIRNAIVPYKKINFSIPNISYNAQGGIPSAEIPETAWALWNEFSIDNGKANIAKLVTDRLHEVVGCTINPGPVNTPELRGIIERLFRTLEILGYHKLVSTTGSSPSDPLRNNPEKQAKKFDISLNDLEELTHVLISDYNGMPHSGIRNFAPLQLMRQRIERGMEPRILEPDKRNNTIFFMLQTIRTVSGNIKEGKRPFVHYMGVNYKSEVLSNSPHLIGTELTLLINIEDIRTLRAFLPDGSEFGYLRGLGAWGLTPHSLRTRKAINKLKKERKIFFNKYQDPFEIYHAYKAGKAKTGKRERNQLAQLQRELNEAEENHNEPDEKYQEAHKTNIIPENIINNELDDEDDDRVFRTLTF